MVKKFDRKNVAVGNKLNVLSKKRKDSIDGELQERLDGMQEQIDALEEAIDFWNKDLEPLTSFVLPGGTALSAALHVARTVCRRAEREVAELLVKESERTSGLTLTYLNRLSDLLFVLGRVANHPEMGGGSGDVLWVPGKNREDAGNG